MERSHSDRAPTNPHDDPKRIYGMPFAGRDVKFKVDGNTITVRNIEC